MAIPGQSKGWKPRVSENGGRCRSGDVVCQAPRLKRGFQGTRFGSPALPRPHPSLSPRARFSACRVATRGQPTGGLATAPRPAPPASLTSAQGVRAGPRRAVSRAGGQLVGAGGWLRLVWATGRRTAVPADRGCGCRVLGFGGAAVAQAWALLQRARRRQDSPAPWVALSLRALGRGLWAGQSRGAAICGREWRLGSRRHVLPI